MTDRPWRPTDDRQLGAGVLEELRLNARPGDVLAIVGVPLLLVAVLLAVGQPDRSLVLVHGDPTPASLVTAHFVHRSVGHLLDNVAAYALVVPTAYALALLSGGRRAFLVAFAGLLVAAPPTISALELLAVEGGVTLGSSGVVMAFVGLLALQTGTYFATRVDGVRADDTALGLFFAGLAFAAARMVSTSRAAIVLAGVAALVAGLFLRHAVGSIRLDGAPIAGLYTRDGQFAALALVVLAVGIVVGFPADPGPAPVVVDRWGHLLGFAIGFLGPYLSSHLVGGVADEVASPPEVAP